MVERNNSSEEKPSTGFSKKYQRATDDKCTKTQSTDHRYQQIDSYGMIGNMRTCAHICKNNGSIDWFCFPHFSSPSIFARILDYDKGGFFEINVLDREGVEMKQGYWPDTNILVTHFTDSKGIGQVVDFMPVIATDPSSKDPDDFPDVRHCMEKSSMQVRDSVGSNSLMAVAPHIAGIHSIQETDKYQQIVRRVEVLQGTKSYVMQCAPAFNYGRDEHQLYLTSDKKRAIFVTEKLAMVLESTIAKLTPVLSPDKKNVAVKSSFSLSEETSETFIFREATKEEKEEALQYFKEKGAVKPKDEKEVQCVDIDSPYSSATQTKADWLFVQTMNYWHDWISKCNYQGRWREHIYRSALTLKLCIFEPTGAIVAAPTASLPESIGGTRNWDYRFTWLRDAAYVIYSLIRIGFYSEAEAFMSFLEKRCKESIHEDLIDIDLDNPDSFEGKNMPKEPPLKTIYTINGKNEDLEEVILDHFEGYKRSSPVRIGNAAATQFQLDIYGELMDSIYLYNKYSKPVSYDFWRYIVYIVNWVCANYGRKDEGVWEVRGGRQHFLYSKVLAWVCIDRGLRLADKRSFPAPRVHWQQSRDKLMNEIMKYGFNPKVQAFTQYYGSETLDASALILPLLLFMSPSDPRMLSTLDAINRRPKKGGLVQNSLVFRYNAEETDDGFSGEAEGTFNMCTFWLIESLCRTGDKKRMMEARLKLEIFFSYSNHLGLFSEEMSTDGHQLGNYPQAFTHLSLISATFNLNRSLNKWRPMTVHH